eukprot:6014713-Alexandrium_andersonii.AAC.1
MGHNEHFCARCVPLGCIRESDSSATPNGAWLKLGEEERAISCARTPSPRGGESARWTVPESWSSPMMLHRRGS